MAKQTNKQNNTKQNKRQFIQKQKNITNSKNCVSITKHNKCIKRADRDKQREHINLCLNKKSNEQKKTQNKNQGERRNDSTHRRPTQTANKTNKCNNNTNINNKQQTSTTHQQHKTTNTNNT